MPAGSPGGSVIGNTLPVEFLRMVRPAGTVSLAASPGPKDATIRQIRSAFQGLMRALHQESGTSLRISILAEPAAQDFINTHAAALDSTFQNVSMSDAMRSRLQRSDYIFSGIKTFHELNEAFPSLLDENGNRKPFERFLNDVQAINETYNQNYLRAEYNFVTNSAAMAAKWEQFQADGDRYNLQYRTAGDDRVREEHAALDGITLPPSDPFWESYYPPNGWNCRCTVIQVRTSKYPATPHGEAMVLGEAAVPADSKTAKFFRFNPGIQQCTVPDYNPYTISPCTTCPTAKGSSSLAAGNVPGGFPAGASTLAATIPSSDLCAACQLLHQCAADRTKSQRAIERTHYLHEMEPLLKVKHKLPIPEGKTIEVGFKKFGLEHLYSDTYGRSKVLTKEDLKGLGNILKGATYIDDAELSHPQKHDITHFYYFQAELRGRKIRLNVAKQQWTSKQGRTKVKYVLYSINDIKEESTEGDS